MTKIPIKQIDFGGEKYDVVHEEKLRDESDDQRLSGSIRHGQCRITLDSSEHLQRQASTLMHECVHYLITMHDLETKDTINPDRKEMLISTIALGMVTIIKRNPNFIRLLQEQV